MTKKAMIKLLSDYIFMKAESDTLAIEIANRRTILGSKGISPTFDGGSGVKKTEAELIQEMDEKIAKKNEIDLTIKKIDILVDALPDKEKQAVKLKYMQRLSQRDVAQQLGFSERSVSRFCDVAIDRLANSWMA